MSLKSAAGYETSAGLMGYNGALVGCGAACTMFSRLLRCPLRDEFPFVRSSLPCRSMYVSV
eukprot:236038-Amphidinium_carterae.1